MRIVFAFIFSISTAFGQLMNNNAMLHSENGLNWYVSNSGSGANDGHNPALPIDVATLLTKVISNDDNIFFNRGETFAIGDYDLTDDDVTLSAYGSGADPILTGGVDISGLTWTHIGGGVYTASVAQEPKWIWINGVCAKNAETARITVSARGAATVTVPNATLDSYTSIVGAYLVVKEKAFQNSIRVTITNYDAPTNVITFTPSGVIPTTGNVDLVVYNDTEFLSGNNEWSWSSGTLTVKAAASPSTLNIKKSDYTYGIKTLGDGITVSDLEFTQYYTAAIWHEGDQLPVNVSNCYFHDIRDTGILVERACVSSSFIDNVFERIGNNGVLTRPSTDFVITGNTFTDIGMQDNWGWQTWSTGPLNINGQDWYSTTVGSAFVYAVDFDDDTYDGSNLTFSNNTVTNVAYCGLNMGIGTGNTVTQNVVTDFTNRFIDGGGLYFFHYRPQNVGNENNEISYNIVSNSNNAHATFGIYMDNRTALSNIHHNTIYNCTVSGAVTDANFAGGIFLNVDTEGHTIEDNNIFGCDAAVVYNQLTDGSFLYADNIDNQFNDNVIATELEAQFFMLFNDYSNTGTWNPYSGTGAADNNAYAGNISPARFFNEDETPDERTFAQHQGDFGEDAASVLKTEVADIVINATNATSNEDAQSNYIDLFTGSTVSTYTIAPYYSRILGRINKSNQLVAASSQYYNAGTTADIQFSHTDIWSISFWFKTPTTTNPASNQIIISNQNSSSRGWGIALTTLGRIQLNLINTVSTNRRQYATTTDIADANWHHVLITVKDTSPEIYVDGGTNSASLVGDNLSATIASTHDLYIGATDGPAAYADILIDGVAIWNSDQTTNRTSIYNNRPQDLLRRSFVPLHYWRMGIAADLLDIGTSATDLNLTGVNSPTSSTDVQN